MYERIIADLGDNYNTSDSGVIKNLIDQVTTNALFISNRSNNVENIELLEFEICECVKTLYLRRGSEDVTGSSQSGLSFTFQDAMDNLRKNIINNGKRIIK